MAWSTGAACGFTDTRSLLRRWAKYSAVMMLVAEAEDAWWPPTLRPSALGLT